MTTTVSLKDFKKALRLKGYDSIADWVRDQRNPQGETVHRTMVYKAIKIGYPQWMLEDIRSTINESRNKHPEFWN